MKRSVYFMAILQGLLLACSSSPGDGDDRTACPDLPASRYAETYRPQVHFSPAANWMNDPNGLVYVDGTFHLFFQHNPLFNSFGPMYWGHAVSRDLVYWERLPTALSPDLRLGQAFSGSAVIDRHNTSGLCSVAPDPAAGCPVALFTRHRLLTGEEQQSLAYSLDEGFSLIPYPYNPVLPNPGLKDFRDPKVFRHDPTDRWIMALSAGDRVEFHSSTDLIAWEFLSSFVPPAGSVPGIIECPELVELPVLGRDGQGEWVLFLSLNTGLLSPGGGVKYFTGSFDGTRFASRESLPRWADFGADFYAAQSWADAPDGRHVWIAWMNNWQYALFAPTDPWRGSMTLPREIGLVEENGEKVLYQRPVAELQKLRWCRLGGERHVTAGETSNPLEGITGNTLEIILTWRLQTATSFGVKLRMNREGDQYTTVGYDVGGGRLFVDRSRSGTGLVSLLSPRQEAPLGAPDGTLGMHIFVDGSSVEVFSDDGRVVMTDTIFPEPDSSGLATFVHGGTVGIESLDVFNLRTIWPE